MSDEDFWSNRFHACALLIGFVAHAEGWLHDSARVRREVYALYEAGGFREQPGPPCLTSRPDRGTAGPSTD